MSRSLELYPVPRPGVEVKPFEGLRLWRNPLNGFVVLEIHYTADPARRGDWKYRASPKYGGLKSWRWRKEQEIEWDAQAGSLVFEMWDPQTHKIRPFPIPEHWPRWVFFDPGWRNPSAIVWVAVDVDSEPNEFGFLPLHIYREFYRSKHSAEACAVIVSEWSTRNHDEKGRPVREWVESIVMDPMAKQEHQSAASPENVNDLAETVFQKFSDKIAELGWDVPCETGNNHKDVAIEEIVARLGRYWVGPDGVPLYDERDEFRQPTPEEIAAGARQVQPTLFFHETCAAGPREMAKYRWKDWAAADVAERHNLQEKPVDKDDHVITNLIRMVNLLRDLRDETGVDLSDFQPRARPRRWRPDDEVIEEEYRTRAARYRERLARTVRGGR